MIITTLLDLLAALLLITAVLLLIGPYVPIWAVVLIAAALVQGLSLLITRRAGAK